MDFEVKSFKGNVQKPTQSKNSKESSTILKKRKTISSISSELSFELIEKIFFPSQRPILITPYPNK
jgi:hypothetical protein